jgi:hypothetical protein
MTKAKNLNIICAGFSRCGTTALAKYIETYADIEVLRAPRTGAYEYKAIDENGITEYYSDKLETAKNLFHKFSGYTYIKDIAKSFNEILKQRENTALIFLIGDPYDRLQSWHAFHKSMAISGTDKLHFTYSDRDFYSKCSLKDYFDKFANNRIDYKYILDNLLDSLDHDKIIILKQEDLRKNPEKTLSILSNKLEFSLGQISKHIVANTTLLPPGTSIENNEQLKSDLKLRYSEILLSMKQRELLLDIDDKSHVVVAHDNEPPAAVSIKPVKFEIPNNNVFNTVLVIGNGPSASLVDFEYLKLVNLPTCGMNSAYRLWEKINYRPNYYICMDSVVIKSHAPAISKLIDENRIESFFLRNEFLELYPQYRHHPRISWFDEKRSEGNKLFETNWITTGSWSLRWMIDLGYKFISVIGVDANYQEVLKEASKTGKYELSINKTPKYNPNYFFDGYQQAGDAYNIPNDPQYVSKHGTTVHADAVIKVGEDLDRLLLPAKIYDLSPLSEHNAFPKLPISNYFGVQRISLTTSFFHKEGKDDETKLNIKALCFNLNQKRIASINLLFEGDYSGFTKLLDAAEKLIIDQNLQAGRLNIININERPSYLAIFNVAKNSTSSVAIVTNSDLIYSDETIEAIITSYAVQSPLSMFCLTRWNQTENGTFLQGQVPQPPWQELNLDQMELLSEVNYLSFDTYVFSANLDIPVALDKVFIGTFGCDTAIAAIFRSSGIIVTNPCLDLRVIHIDNKPRNYSGESGNKQVLANVEAFKLTLNNEINEYFKGNSIVNTLEIVKRGSLSIGTPAHALGWWYCLFRMFGASPWLKSTDASDIVFEKINIDPDSIITIEDDITHQFQEAMRKGKFLEIYVDGSNGEHYLGCFNKSEKLKEIKNQLYRYDRQYVLFEQDVDEKTRREFDKLILFVKAQFLVANKGPGQNLHTFPQRNQPSIQKVEVNVGKKLAINEESTQIVHKKDWLSSLNSLPLNLPLSANNLKILIIDSTPLGSSSATGQIKKTFFGHIENVNLIQVWEHTGNDPGLRVYRPETETNPNSIPPSCDESEILAMLHAFKPSIIYFRSTASEKLHKFHHLAINVFKIPSIIHIMDDWEARMLFDKNPNHPNLLELLVESIQKSQVKLSICDKMSKEFSQRYGGSWKSLANAVELDHIPHGSKLIQRTNAASASNQIVIKYMGGLAEDMNAKSILELATVVDELSREGANILFEIYTMSWYLKWAENNLGIFNSVSVKPLVPLEHYKETIESADVSIIAYNFDQKSIAYTRLSMANKLPEILAAGNTLFAYGPLDIATVQHIHDKGLGPVVVNQDVLELKQQLKKVIFDENLRSQCVANGISYAKSNYSLRQMRYKINAFFGLAISKSLV